MEALEGAIVMLVGTEVATVMVVLAVTFDVDAEPDDGAIVAVIVVVPTATAVASPDELTVATVVLDDVHVAWLVTSSVLPLPSVPVALNCCVLPGCTAGFVGDSVMETMLLPETKNFPHADSHSMPANANSANTLIQRTISILKFTAKIVSARGDADVSPAPESLIS